MTQNIVQSTNARYISEDVKGPLAHAAVLAGTVIGGYLAYEHVGEVANTFGVNNSTMSTVVIIAAGALAGNMLAQVLYLLARHLTGAVLPNETVQP